MCHGHPHYHCCGHQSVTWHYCPSAGIDLKTGYETPCPNTTFATSQPSTSSCPLANCDFRSAGGGGWTCCICGGWNTGGWCGNTSPNPKWEQNPITNEWEWIERCDHGCCRNCAKDRESRGGSTQLSLVEVLDMPKGSVLTVAQAPACNGESSRKVGRKSRVPRKHQDAVESYDITLNYGAKDGMSSTPKEKDQKSSSHRRGEQKARN